MVPAATVLGEVAGRRTKLGHRGRAPSRRGIGGGRRGLGARAGLCGPNRLGSALLIGSATTLAEAAHECLCRRLRIAALPGKGTVLRVASDHAADEGDALPGGIMTRNVRQLLAALALAAATGTGGYLAGSSAAENADWHTGTARVMGEPEDPEITAHDDDWDYAATGDVDWIDKLGTQHTGDVAGMSPGRADRQPSLRRRVPDPIRVGEGQGRRNGLAPDRDDRLPSLTRPGRAAPLSGRRPWNGPHPGVLALDVPATLPRLETRERRVPQAALAASVLAEFAERQTVLGSPA